MFRNMNTALGLTFVGVSLLPTSVKGAVTITFQQQGADVVASYSGSWDAWTPMMSTDSIVNAVANFGSLSALQGGPGSKSYMITTPMTQSLGSLITVVTSASSFTGDPFGFNLGGDYFAPQGYTAGDPLSGSLTFADTDLETMGFTPGDAGVFSGGGNTVTYSVAAIPEPSYLFLIGTTGLAAFMRRRRKITCFGS